MSGRDEIIQALRELDKAARASTVQTMEDINKQGETWGPTGPGVWKCRQGPEFEWRDVVVRWVEGAPLFDAPSGERDETRVGIWQWGGRADLSSADVGWAPPKPSEELTEAEVSAGVAALAARRFPGRALLEMVVESIADASHWEARALRAEKRLGR